MDKDKSPNRTPSICWDCRNAVPEAIDGVEYGCPWSREAMPVPGWDAEPSRFTAGSFRVRKCPEFIPEHDEKPSPKPKKKVPGRKPKPKGLDDYWTQDGR